MGEREDLSDKRYQRERAKIIKHNVDNTLATDKAYESKIIKCVSNSITLTASSTGRARRSECRGDEYSTIQ